MNESIPFTACDCTRCECCDFCADVEDWQEETTETEEITPGISEEVQEQSRGAKSVHF